MKRVLLHICCGPCAIYPAESLKKTGYNTEGFFYNPNIQPQSEYLKREEAVKNFEKIFGLKVNFGGYEKEIYQKHTQSAKDKDSRCRSCFRLRLKQAHDFALEHEFDFFTTTLLVSPYQDQALIKEIGREVSRGSRAQFLFYDFRPGFREGHTKAKELNLYCQQYCGCLASLQEREAEKSLRRARC